MLRGHNKSMLGKKLSKEAIKKIKLARANQIFTRETRIKMSRSSTGNKNHFWKGGRYQMKRGYICIWMPDHPNANRDGYIYEHRLIMEKMIGRYLTSREVVHHLNGIRNDNRPENLELFNSNAEHMKIEFITRLKK